MQKLKIGDAVHVRGRLVGNSNLFGCVPVQFEGMIGPVMIELSSIVHVEPSLQTGDRVLTSIGEGIILAISDKEACIQFSDRMRVLDIEGDAIFRAPEATEPKRCNEAPALAKAFERMAVDLVPLVPEGSRRL